MASDAEELKAIRGLYAELHLGIQDCMRLAVEVKAGIHGEGEVASNCAVNTTATSGTGGVVGAGSCANTISSTSGTTFADTDDKCSPGSAALGGALDAFTKEKEDRHGFAVVFSSLPPDDVPLVEWNTAGTLYRITTSSCLPHQHRISWWGGLRPTPATPFTSVFLDIRVH